MNTKDIKTLISSLKKKEKFHDDDFAKENVLSDDTPFSVKESYKMMRTNIIFSVAGKSESGCKLIALTSANAGEGKTTTTVNLAIAFAQTGSRVLAVDCDMRKSRLHRYLQAKREPGLSTLISKQVSIDEAITKNVRPGLDVLTAGEIPPNPAELLSSDRMKEIIDELSQHYDYIFFDTPPVTVVTDAVALSQFLDGIIVVVRQNYTNHENIASVVKTLNIAKAKILGFIVNDASRRFKYNNGYYSFVDDYENKTKK